MDVAIQGLKLYLITNKEKLIQADNKAKSQRLTEKITFLNQEKKGKNQQYGH